MVLTLLDTEASAQVAWSRGWPLMRGWGRGCTGATCSVVPCLASISICILASQAILSFLLLSCAALSASFCLSSAVTSSLVRRFPCACKTISPGWVVAFFAQVRGRDCPFASIASNELKETRLLKKMQNKGMKRSGHQVEISSKLYVNYMLTLTVNNALTKFLSARAPHSHTGAFYGSPKPSPCGPPASVWPSGLLAPLQNTCRVH